MTGRANHAMTRADLPLILGLLLLLVLAALGLSGIAPVMPSYLAAWLFVLSIPAGSLLLITLTEMMGGPSPALLPLRALLPLLPLVSIAGLPVLLWSGLLWPAAGWPSGAGRLWFAHGPVMIRMVLFLLLWSAMALLFAAAPASSGRRGLAGIGFALLLVTGTLAANDWVLAVEPGLASSSIGLVLLSGWAVCGVASLALLGASPGLIALPMLGLLSVWTFLNFTQFLVVWSANEPHESLWYLHRISGLGAAALWLAAALFVLALVALLPRATAIRRRPVLAIAGLALLVQCLDAFWLVTPAFRAGFVLTLADLLAGAGLVALCAGLWRRGWLPHRLPGRLAHAGR